MQWPPAFMKDLNTTNYGMWNAPDPALLPNGKVVPGEGGVDLATPNGTPVYALADGPLVAAGYFRDSGHGVITQRVNVPGLGLEDIYYQHIQLDPSVQRCLTGQCSQTFKKGQLIGTVGPYNEIELGFNSRWGNVWGTNHPSSTWPSDPRPWLRALLGTGAPLGGDPGASGSTNQGNPLDPIGAFWATARPTFIQWGEYAAIFLLAVLLVIVGFFLLGGQSAMQAVRKVA